MSDNKGYVIKRRSIYDWYKSVAEMDIYALAIYDYLATYVRKDKTVYKGITLDSGQLLRSYGQIADALKIGRRTVVRKMKILKDVGVISVEQINLGSAFVITVKDFADHDHSDGHEAKDDSAQDIDLDKMLDALD